jgi:hypothetical protein
MWSYQYTICGLFYNINELANHLLSQKLNLNWELNIHLHFNLKVYFWMIISPLRLQLPTINDENIFIYTHFEDFVYLFEIDVD